MKAVLDTNILVDYLVGKEQARKELELYDEAFISVITWMEILAGVDNAREETPIRQFLNRFLIQYIDDPIAERAVSLRRKEKIRLPDAIIWATSQELGYILVTRNTRDFPSDHPGIRVPYRL